MLAAAGALLLSPFVLTAPASAHDVFTGSTPSAGSTVTSVPTSVTLHFEEPPLAAGLAVAVTAPDHSLVTGANPTLAGTDVVAPVAPLTVSGVYTVAWRVVADDGHPVTGTFTFTVDLGSAAPSASATIPSSASLAATATPDGSSSSVPVGWIVACAGAVALAAVVVVAVSRRRLT
jgi:methionine-rich copper-binding protein CopC